MRAPDQVQDTAVGALSGVLGVLDDRMAVEMAKGLLAERDAINPVAALETLRQMARGRNAALVEVARGALRGDPTSAMTTTPPAPSQRGAPVAADSGNDRLFRVLHESRDAAERARARELLVARHTGLVRWAASRCFGRGEQPEVLVQVGYVGLMKAIHRFDPDRGVNFAAFAAPTVLGEIRRHFRDTRPWVRIPRAVQQRKAEIREAVETLTHRHGHPPTTGDLATFLRMGEEAVREAIAAQGCFAPISLDGAGPTGTEAQTHIRALGAEDTRIDHLVDMEALRPILATLPQRTKDLVRLRFYDDHSQAEIARRLGISQPHVSRLLDSTLADLRTQLMAS